MLPASYSGLYSKVRNWEQQLDDLSFKGQSETLPAISSGRVVTRNGVVRMTSKIRKNSSGGEKRLKNSEIHPRDKEPLPCTDLMKVTSFEQNLFTKD
ncbi:hypothetical protein [Endozoicomonas numazuensis]|uniref:Uncharacterized protein n=1 Tax=Endozoicomonas numazuensis TaxID=1137799 RepID=A0A081NK30_9GAMM|nr:hypothetical protein [Endozoicomonas numazuensis]KEQ18803.1 hypothetical protein GZ78_01590 [Endozoicomonas numazuensis]